MSYRARCNKRACQARRTIKGVYDPNDREKCHDPKGVGCCGLMRKDVTRERDVTKDASGGGKLCRCDGLTMSSRNSPHRYGCRGCRHHDEYIIEKAFKPRSKHSPTSVSEDDDGAPF